MRENHTAFHSLTTSLVRKYVAFPCKVMHLQGLGHTVGIRLRLFACASLVGKYRSAKRSRVPEPGIVQEQGRDEEGLSDFGSLARVLAPVLRIERDTQCRVGVFGENTRRQRWMDRAMLLLWIPASYTAFMRA
jgi:hypothetical protein